MPTFSCQTCGNTFELEKNPHNLSNELVHLGNIVGQDPTSCEDCVETIEAKWKRHYE